MVASCDSSAVAGAAGPMSRKDRQLGFGWQCRSIGDGTAVDKAKRSAAFTPLQRVTGKRVGTVPTSQHLEH